LKQTLNLRLDNLVTSVAVTKEFTLRLITFTGPRAVNDPASIRDQASVDSFYHQPPNEDGFYSEAASTRGNTAVWENVVHAKTFQKA